MGCGFESSEHSWGEGVIGDRLMGFRGSGLKHRSSRVWGLGLGAWLASPSGRMLLAPNAARALSLFRGRQGARVAGFRARVAGSWGAGSMRA
eukprot:6940999-Pyramimonas_sp.AAC.1